MASPLEHAILIGARREEGQRNGGAEECELEVEEVVKADAKVLRREDRTQNRRTGQASRDMPAPHLEARLQCDGFEFSLPIQTLGRKSAAARYGEILQHDPQDADAVKQRQGRWQKRV